MIFLVACASQQVKTKTAEPASREEIRLVIRKELESIKKCYEIELKTTPKLEGKIVVQFELIQDGVVREAHIIQTTLQNSNVENCVINVIKAARFPAPPDKTFVVIDYPFVFGQSPPKPK